MKTPRMTKAELVSRQKDLPALSAELEAVDREREPLHEEWRRLRGLTGELGRVDEVFEGEPLAIYDGHQFRAEPLGEDEYQRTGYVNPIDPPDEDISEDPDVPIPYRGWLLQLAGAGSTKAEREWKAYPPDQRAAAVLAAKRFAAHGVVPLPDAARAAGWDVSWSNTDDHEAKS